MKRTNHAIQVKVVDADSAEEYGRLLTEHISGGWSLVSEHRNIKNGRRWYSATVKYDYAKHFEIHMLREQVTANSSQIQQLFRLVDQLRSGSTLDDTQVLIPTSY
jgi:hypothetical protein